MTIIEFDMYIPPNVDISDAGVIDPTQTDEVYYFNDNEQLFLCSFSGYGFPEIEYITQRGPFQHGRTALDYRLQPRLIKLAHERTGQCREDWWDNRAELLDKLRPNRQLVNTFNPGVLRKILPGGATRDLKAIISSGPPFSPSDTSVSDEFQIKESIIFIAHDPILFNPSQFEGIWVLESLENLIFYESPNWTDRLIFEGNSLTSGGIWFGETSIGDTLDVIYTGTWLSYPKIIITGPLDNVRILNNTTEEQIELDYDIALGETVTINLDYGKKTITNNTNENLIGTATPESDIATFHIAPHPEALNGLNELQVLGDNAVIGNTEIKITYYERYFGI